jgi:acyl-CoA thioester hydrolase
MTTPTTTTETTETPKRSDFTHVLTIQTRWGDNDIYGHVNNVVFYSWFDTVINRYLIASGALDPAKSEVIGLCVESKCQYFRPAAYPEDVEAGLRVGKLGRSSVRYEVGIFRVGESEPLAFGHFVHVFVDRQERRSTAMPPLLRGALERLLVSPPASREDAPE